MLVICHRNGWTNVLIMKLLWMELMLATISAIFLEVALPFFRSKICYIDLVPASLCSVPNIHKNLVLAYDLCIDESG